MRHNIDGHSIEDPVYLNIRINSAVKVFCYNKEGELVDMIIQPGEHTLAYQSDQKGNIIGPWRQNCINE